MKYLVLFLLSFNLLASGVVIPVRDANGKIIQKNDAFASKSSYNFRGTGIVCVAAASVITNCDFTISYAHVKFNGIQIEGGALGDKANLKVIDTAAGTYSGVANATLNQFGINWNLSPYTREKLPYASDLYSGMIIRVEYVNSEATVKNIYINYYIHEE